MPWFSKQGPALAFDDNHPDHIVIAEDISQHGHKRYGVFPRADVDNFAGGPCNELIRTHCPCRLYFDLDGRDVTDEVVPGFVALVQAKFARQLPVIVLCSSNATKFSKHVIFPDVIFQDNWTHMRNWVHAFTLELPANTRGLVDTGVYTRNRCFRMAGCCKYSDVGRPFLPGPPSSALVQAPGHVGGLECIREGGVQCIGREGRGGGEPVGSFDVQMLKTYEKKLPLDGLEPDDLLHVLHPDQGYRAFFAIGCAYKRAGGSCDAFCEWCKAYRHKAGVTRQWRGWNKNEKGYGYPFLKSLALHSASNDECYIHLDEAFGFHPTNFVSDTDVTRFESQYLHYKHITTVKERAVLVKSPTGSGKSTVARELARRFSDKRILYIVSSRPLAFGAKESLNKLSNTLKWYNTRSLEFVSYLETNKPLWKYDHLVCSIQSIWRAYRMERKRYDLIIIDELSSVIEDCCNITNKHPKENQEALRWFSERCERWVGLDAHLMDTSLCLAADYFPGDVRVLVNHYVGPRKDAVFIPLPLHKSLNRVRAKATCAGAIPRDVTAFRDGTCMYDLMFQCWSQQVKTFFVCNNVQLGNWVEENYLRRSFTWMACLWAGLCDDLATLITDFCCKGDNKLQRQLLQYAWVKRGDGRTGKDFRTLDWWSKIDHLQYTLKICQGLDFNPPKPCFGVGFCYTTPNTCVPRRNLQQITRIRKLKPNPVRQRPTVFFAVGERVMVKHLPVWGLAKIEKYANDQEYFMQAVVKHHSAKFNDFFAWHFKPEPVWRKLYLMVMNERETFLRYPRKSFEWWLAHDDWTTSTLQTRPKPLIQWRQIQFRDPKNIQYADIPAITSLEYTWLVKRRNRDALQELQLKRYRHDNTFLGSGETWKLQNDCPGWVSNVLLERFGSLDAVLQRRFNKFAHTQSTSGWLDMTGPKLVIVRKITAKLGLTELWNSSGTLVGPGAYQRAETFVTQNQEQIRLSFGRSGETLKKLIFSWGGYKLKTHERARRRVANDDPLRLGLPLNAKDARAVKQAAHTLFPMHKVSRRVDVSIRKVESPPWHLLRYPTDF